MIRISCFVMCFVVCLTRCSDLRKHIPRVELCIVAGLVFPISAYPSFYDLGDEVLDLETKYKVPTRSTTEEAPVPDEWKMRSTYRVKCADETRISPQKVVNLIAGKGWSVNDSDVQKWVLCVLVKMGLMSEEGVFRMDVAMSKINSKDKEFADALIDNCLPKNAMEPQEIAWNYVKCHNTAKGNFSAISVF